MTAVVMVGYLALGVMQFFAIIAGLQVLGVHWLLSGILAVIVTYIPVIGTTAGVYGAVMGWGWPLSHSLALFLGPFVIIAMLALIDARR